MMQRFQKMKEYFVLMQVNCFHYLLIEIGGSGFKDGMTSEKASEGITSYKCRSITVCEWKHSTVHTQMFK
jgi:hypothetical protein